MIPSTFDGLSLKAKYRLLGSMYTVQQQLDTLHSLSKELKAQNRARINDVVKGIKVDERVDEILLKAD